MTPKGRVVSPDATHLHGPIGLVLVPGGDFITANGDAATVNPDPNQPSDLVEFTRNGQFVNQLSISNTPGAAFGLGLTTSDQGIFLGAVNDVDHTLEVWKHFFPTQKKTG